LTIWTITAISSRADDQARDADGKFASGGGSAKPAQKKARAPLHAAEKPPKDSFGYRKLLWDEPPKRVNEHGMEEVQVAAPGGVPMWQTLNYARTKAGWS